jgi:hypothetical protein
MARPRMRGMAMSWHRAGWPVGTVGREMVRFRPMRTKGPNPQTVARPTPRVLYEIPRSHPTPPTPQLSLHPQSTRISNTFALLRGQAPHAGPGHAGHGPK